MKRKYKPIKNLKKNRDRNILLAIENLMCQLQGIDSDSEWKLVYPKPAMTLSEILPLFYSSMKPRWWDK